MILEVTGLAPHAMLRTPVSPSSGGQAGLGRSPLRQLLLARPPDVIREGSAAPPGPLYCQTVVTKAHTAIRAISGHITNIQCVPTLFSHFCRVYCSYVTNSIPVLCKSKCLFGAPASAESLELFQEMPEKLEQVNLNCFFLYSMVETIECLATHVLTKFLSFNFKIKTHLLRIGINFLLPNYSEKVFFIPGSYSEVFCTSAISVFILS